MESLVACVWSCDPAVALDYPARYLFTFLQHHGMLQIFGSPQWRTVTGGSREYVAKVAARLPDVRTGTKVTSVLETADGRGGHRRQRRRSTPTTRSWSPPTPARRSRCWPSRPPRSATCSPRCRTPPTPRSCTPTRACCPATSAPGRRGTTCDGPSAAATAPVTVSYDMTRLMRLPGPRGRHAASSSPSAARTSSTRRRSSTRWSTSTRSTRPPPWRPSAGCPSATPTGSSSPAPGTAGASTRTAPARASQAAARLGVEWGTAGPSRCPSRPRRTTPRSGTPAASRSRAPSPTARAPGWSTSTTCPTTGPGPLRGARPPRRPRRAPSRTTSSTSSPSTASSPTAAGS